MKRKSLLKSALFSWFIACVILLSFFFQGCAGRDKYQARLNAEVEVIQANRDLIQARNNLVEKISTTPLVSICEGGKCITVNQHIDSALLSANPIQANFPDPDGVAKAAWGGATSIFTTALKVGMGMYIGHEAADFLTATVKNAGHNTTLQNHDGDMSTNFSGNSTVTKPNGDLIQQGDESSASPTKNYNSNNQNGDNRENPSSNDQSSQQNNNGDSEDNNQEENPPFVW